MKNIQSSKLKILLIYPPTGKISNYNTPTGLLYIATVLKRDGYKVGLVDCSVEPDYENILKREIIDTDILGVYAMSVHITYLLPLLRKLKTINKRIKIIWGGPHAMLFPEQTVKSEYADIVARCEGEDLMLEIARKFESGSLDLHQVKGITFQEDGQIINTPDREFVEINKLPFIDWSLVKKEVMEVVKKTVIRVQTSRGCPYKCTFCINVLTKNKKMRYRDPERVLDEIEYVGQKYGAKRIGFRDEIFLSNRKQAKEIAEGILKRNLHITWIANPRVEYLRESYIDDDFLKLLADSGCSRLQCGGESGSQRILDMLHKDIEVDDILNFVKRTKKYKIYPVVAFLTGLPTETEEEQLQTLALIREILRIQPKAFVNGPANYRPYPGGDLFDLCIKKYHLKMPESLEEWAKAEVLGGSKPPWVKKLHVNQYIWTGIRTVTYPYSAIREKARESVFTGLGILLMKIVSTFRLRFLFYKLPFEYRLLDIYHRYILKKVPDYS